MVIQLPVATRDPGPAGPRAILLHFRARQDISERLVLRKELVVTYMIVYSNKSNNDKKLMHTKLHYILNFYLFETC